MARFEISKYLPIDSIEAVDRLLEDIEKKNRYFSDIEIGYVLKEIKKVKYQLYFRTRIDSLNSKLAEPTTSSTDHYHQKSYERFYIEHLVLPDCLSGINFDDLLPIKNIRPFKKFVERIWLSNIELTEDDIQTIQSNFNSQFLNELFTKTFDTYNKRLEAYDRRHRGHRTYTKKHKKSKEKHESNSMYTCNRPNLRPVSIPMGGMNKRY